MSGCASALEQHFCAACQTWVVPAERPTRLSDDDYLRQVETLAQLVADEALDEGWLTYGDDTGQSPLQRAINELARSLRHQHGDGDGCLDG